MCAKPSLSLFQSFLPVFLALRRCLDMDYDLLPDLFRPLKVTPALYKSQDETLCTLKLFSTQ